MLIQGWEPHAGELLPSGPGPSCSAENMASEGLQRGCTPGSGPAPWASGLATLEGAGERREGGRRRGTVGARVRGSHPRWGGRLCVHSAERPAGPASVREQVLTHAAMPMEDIRTRSRSPKTTPKRLLLEEDSGTGECVEQRQVEVAEGQVEGRSRRGAGFLLEMMKIL